MAGATNTQDGLKLALDMFLNNPRGDAQKIAVVLSDGVSNILPENTIPSADELRLNGVVVFAIGMFPNFPTPLQHIKF